ncbi:MAG: chaperone NapD [Gammaproteobacteria bacterium]
MTEPTGSEIRVAGLLVHTNAARSEAIHTTLDAMPGVEVATRTDDHRLVVVCEELPGAPRLSDTIVAIDQVEGVINTSLVYQHTEPEDDEADDAPATAA